MELPVALIVRVISDEDGEGLGLGSAGVVGAFCCLDGFGDFGCRTGESQCVMGNNR